MADFGFTEEGLVIAGDLMATWEEIDKRRNVIRLQNKILVKVSFSYSRGDWYHHQIFDKTSWKNIKEVLTGRTAWYHDFAGKHSEVALTFFEDVNLEEITDFKTIETFYNQNGWEAGNLYIIDQALEQLIDNGEIERVEEGIFQVI